MSRSYRQVAVLRCGTGPNRASLGERKWHLTWGGAEGTRTPDPLVANEVRYQLRHSPVDGVRSLRRG
jgi:hypothetical protein